MCTLGGSPEGLMAMLCRLGEAAIRPENVHVTPIGRHEFAAVLRK